MKNRNARKLATTLLVGGITLLGVVLAYVKFSPAQNVPEAEQRSVTHTLQSSYPGNEKPTLPREKVKILKPAYTPDDEIVYSESSKDVEKSQNRYVVAINGFLESAKVTEPGAKATSAKLEGKVLVVEFTEPFGISRGTDDERTIIDGLIHVLGQFKDVKSLRILVSGERIETLGSVDLLEDLKVQD
jgi:hypothetical protein